eukprot:m.115332 g.115332  ORF g.115332 m.115332 type:complete len:439 (+) comp15365_c0_seq9:101-1417(+)
MLNTGSRMASLLARALTLALALRLLLISLGCAVDAISRVPYTDVDYHVFTESAQHIWRGRSPYDRHTYRYTPLIAFISLPSLWLPVFGKILFSLADILVGLLIFHLHPDQPLVLSSSGREQENEDVDQGQKVSEDLDVQQGQQQRHAHHQLEEHLQQERLSTWRLYLSNLLNNKPLLCSAAWLFNPITVGVSTRGNAEAVILAVVMLCLYFALHKRPFLSGIMLGLAVHLKLYPIIYSLPLFLYVSPAPFWKPSPARVHLITGFLLGAAVPTLFFYLAYGMEFIQEAYLYHFTRGDIRHNFSVYFYALYLQAQEGLSFWSRISAFLPQAIVQLSSAIRYSQDLIVCFYTQTLLFVAFNKVFTSQYFLWFLPFLCLLIHRIHARAIIFWFVAQGIWLAVAFLVEFEGQPQFLSLFAACIVLFVSHLALIRVSASQSIAA